jgi:DNA processing protein
MIKNLTYAYLRLIHTHGFGPKGLALLFEGIKKNNLAVEDIFSLSKADFELFFPELGKGRLQSSSWENLTLFIADLTPIYKKMEAAELKITTILDDCYPKTVLAAMGQAAPTFLFSKGNIDLFNSQGIAIVGARNANEKTLELTQNIAKKLAENGINVVSGFAKGVDTNAHLGALDNHGTTTMVLSFGLFELAKQKIFEQVDWDSNSLAVSQFDLSEKWRGSNAMMRNKLVCSLSKAVLIIASGKERDATGKMSGTFDAGRSALNMGIPLFVVSPTSQCFLGCPPEGNQDLIKLGAIEVKSFKQIIAHFQTEEAATNIVATNNNITQLQQQQPLF